MNVIDPRADFLRGGVGATSTPSITPCIAEDFFAAGAFFAAGFFSVVTSVASLGDLVFFVCVVLDRESFVLEIGLMRSPRGFLLQNSDWDQIFGREMPEFEVPPQGQLCEPQRVLERSAQLVRS